jgi:hypothetical protein
MRSLPLDGKGGDEVTAERNLVLVHTPRLQARSDFEAIQLKLAETAPDIEVFIVNNNAPNSVSRRQAARRPAVIFSPVPLREFKPLRGRIYAGRGFRKMEEVRRMAAAGLPVPETIMIEPETRLDPDTWGPFTVVKPNRGKQGSGVVLRRTRDVRWADPLSFPKGHPHHGVPLLAQRFVDTGTHLTHCRVLAVFDRAVYSTRTRRNDACAPRDPNGTEPLDEPIAANTGERSLSLNYEPDILELGASVWRAFPDVPVLGADIIREAATGKLYVLEVNAGGLTWHLSSDYGMEWQRRRGLDYASQFGAIDIISAVLVEKTRRDAV